MYQLSLALVAALAGLLPAQLCPPPRVRAQPPPPPPVWSGPGDVISTPAAENGPAEPAAPTGTTTTAATPRATQLPQHLRHIPVHVARALARYGAQLDLTHERTALSRLSYDWNYAEVIKPPAQGPTVAAHRPRALPLGEAVARVAANDRRPFLVLRECWQCGGGEETDIGRKLANEKTILYSKWFRCVRVSDAVRHPDHPLHALFAGPNAPHLVLGSVHGDVRPVASGEPLSALWTSMRRLIAEAYEEDPDAAIQEELGILSRFDHLDNLERSLSSRLDTAVETQPAGAPQIATLRQQLADLAAQRSATEAHEQRVMRRTLRKSPLRSAR